MKQSCAHKQIKEFFYYFPSASKCSGFSRKTGPQYASQLPGKSNAITQHVPLSSSFSPAEHPLVSSGQLSKFRPFPTPCSSPTSSLMRQHEKQRKPWHCANIVQKWLKNQCAINAVLVTNTKDSTIRVAIKKVKSIPSKLSASGWNTKRLKVNLYWRENVTYFIFLKWGNESFKLFQSLNICL